MNTIAFAIGTLIGTALIVAAIFTATAAIYALEPDEVRP